MPCRTPITLLPVTIFSLAWEERPAAEELGDRYRLLVPDITDHDDLLVLDEVFGRTPGAFLR
ncbi:hypothetical protein ABZT27_34985 [Streptomyces sp. NPDC005389]|uniref:hypothetical protein n=1 Tax=Streptomyces sp. NPDC005389 TaxID=3157040 RepID=UPI0033AFBB50